MPDNSTEMLVVLREMRELLRAMAEPAIAERDRKLRDELRRIVGKGEAKAKSVLLMDGSRTQLAIRNETGMNQGNLSTLVKELKARGLVAGDGKQPKLAFSVPPNFFD